MDVLREDTERKQDEYESIKRQVMAMSIDELRNYVINSMIEENYHNQGYDDYEDEDVVDREGVLGEIGREILECELRGVAEPGVNAKV